MKQSTLGFTIDFQNLKPMNPEKSIQLKEFLYQHKLLILKNVDLSIEEYLIFAKSLGEVVKFVDADYHHPDYSEIFVVSNIQKDGKKFGMDRVGYYWHSDSSFMPMPLPITMLYSQIVPKEGGETAFINMAEVYQQLKTEYEIDHLTATHEGKWRYLITHDDIGLSIEEILERDEKLVPSQRHPLVIQHPKTGEKAVYFSQGITKRIVEMDENRSRAMLDKIEKTILSAPIYQHRWETQELILWDNRSVVHRAFPSKKGESRLMFRIGVQDGNFFNEA